MTELVPNIRFDTMDVPAEERLASWAAMIPWFEVGILPGAGDFSARADAWLLDGLVLSITTLSAVWLERSNALIAADPRTDYAVVVSDTAWDLRTGDDGTTRVEAGAVCILDNTQDFRVEAIRGVYIILNVPRVRIDDPLQRADLHGRVISDTLAMVFCDFLGALRARLPVLPAAQAPALANALSDLLAACLATGNSSVWAAGVERAPLVKARAFIEQNIADTLSVDEIAAAMGVSRSRLYRIFAGVGGVERFVIRRRLHRARSMLRGGAPRRTIADVAYANGFTSTAHFSRLFKAEFGMTPTEARSDGFAPAETPGALTQTARVFRGWLDEAPVARRDARSRTNP
jgi:AraC-like DNA-binding protein